MFDHDDDSRGFWDDEPTRPLERFTARLKPAGAPPPAPTRLWANRANAPGRTHGEAPPTRSLPAFDPTIFDDLDDDFVPPTTGPRRGPRPARPPRPQPQDNWPASVGEAFGMLARKGRDTGRNVASRIDPMMRRTGVIVLLVLLCIPVALALRGGDAHGETMQPTTAYGTTPTDASSGSAPDGSETTLDAATAAPGNDALVVTKPVACAKTYSIVAGDYWVLIAAKADTSLDEILAANHLTRSALLLPGHTVCLPADATWPTLPPTPSTLPPTTPAPTTTARPTPMVVKAAAGKPVVAACTQRYTVVAGDAWSLIARRMSVTTAQLLAANNASTRTVLLPGRSVCLPGNAVIPAAPKPTPTTVKPTPTTVKAPKAPSTTVRPTPTTVKPAPKHVYTPAEVTQIINTVFPAELRAKALVIAMRESHLNPLAQNFCCYGVFQINYAAHARWLPSIGVTSAQQLLDPMINAQAALIIYQRSNSWAPWGG